ncbi:MAG: hypothetical protein EOP48_27725 [Sphingobacteriales bacterium]|nr:MAG: hypothetical protein EOP48_27725 [Sphingobacteriales bacterium]
MIFEAMDWGAEAKLVATAFGLYYQCEFQDRGNHRQLKLPDHKWPYLADGRLIQISYLCAGDGGREFIITHKDNYHTDIFINFDGEIHDDSFMNPIDVTTTRALFLLGLLTPEVESHLTINVSAHQKAEWLLEHHNQGQHK